MDSHPEQLDYIFDRKDGFDVSSSRKEYVDMKMLFNGYWTLYISQDEYKWCWLTLFFFVEKSSEPTPSPKKSPGPQVHAHFFPQQSQDAGDFVEPGQTEENDQPRRMYVREQFTHENQNTVRGNVTEPSDPIIRR